jgi:hypothetical protein
MQSIKDSKRDKRPKAGNSELFNEVFSASNALSVTEKTRLIKSLAGQLGLVVVGSADLLRQAKPGTQKREPDRPKVVSVRPNPLKGTRFEIEKDQAYKALVEAKKAANGEKLPPDHPSVVAYATALKAYKDAHSALQTVVSTTSVEAAKQPAREKKKARTATTRSPEPPVAVSSSKSTKRPSIIGRLQELAGGGGKQH